MTTEDISGTIRQFIRSQFRVSNDDRDFSDDVHLFDYGYVDSFGAVTLTEFVENSFQIKISDTDMIAYPLNTIAEISHFVLRRKNREI